MFEPLNYISAYGRDFVLLSVIPLTLAAFILIYIFDKEFLFGAKSNDKWVDKMIKDKNTTDKE